MGKKLEFMFLLAGFALISSNAYSQAKYRLWSGETLTAGQSIGSVGGKYSLIMQTDGSLVMYRTANGSVRYSFEKHGTYAVMQTDGNFVEYAGSTPLWDSGTGNCCAGRQTYLEITDDGNLAIYDWHSSPSLSYGTLIWQIGTDPTPVGSVRPPYPMDKLQPPGPPPSNIPDFANPYRPDVNNSPFISPRPRI